MSERIRRRRSRDARHRDEFRGFREDCGLSPANRLRIAADVQRNSTSDDDSGCVLEEYAWWPSGLKPDMVHLFFSCLPEDKVPYVGSGGEKWRARQLRHQMPAQDSDARYCGELTREEQEELRIFDRARKDECIGVGLVQKLPYDGLTRNCTGCSESLDEGELVVVAARTSTFFHPACFHCYECRTLLVDLIYFAHQGKVYCGRHHAEQIKPRCARCDELIFGEECTEAEGRTWHLNHFQCSNCAEVLGGKKYMQRNGKPTCLTCFHENDASVKCSSCKGNIANNNPQISQGDFQWHADSTCFSCSVCQKNLLGLKFSLLNGRLLCGYKQCETEKSSVERYRQGEPHARLQYSLSSPITNRSLASPRLASRQSAPRASPQLSVRPTAPRPPQRAPPSPPSENIYETVLPCTSSSPEFEKKYGSEGDRTSNYYSKTPNIGTRPCEAEFSTSSSDSDEDDDFYVANLMAAASLSRTSSRKPQQLSTVRIAKKKKSNRCIVS